MSLPIAETPILYGEDAEEFVRRMKWAETHPVPREEYERAKKVYDEVNAKAKERGEEIF
jgi:hypothetical protein